MKTATAESSGPDLDRIFGALSDPTRRQIVHRLTRGDATLSELAEPFNLTMPGLSKHVTVLERAGLVRKWRDGRSRFCRLVPEHLVVADDWLRSQTEFWHDRLDGLEAFLEAENQTDHQAAGDPGHQPSDGPNGGSSDGGGQR